METKDVLLSEGEKYFEKVMQDFNQNRKGRNLRKYCNDEGIDYKWLSEYKRTYGATKTATSPQPAAPDYEFTALDVIEERLSPEQYAKKINKCFLFGFVFDLHYLCSVNCLKMELWK